MEPEEINQENMDEKKGQSNVLDVLSGRESIKFDVSLSWETIIYVALGAIVIGTVLIGMKKLILK
ncbi:MAG: hypothetical protein J5642_02590 [Bacteroidales bacterium]|nr:hypothetical protein [Bacteroidales bacterium]